jgi:hypothetical protein
MKDNSEVAKFYRQKEQQRKERAKRPVAEKLAVATKLRAVQGNLAPARAANKARRAAGKVEIRIKTTWKLDSEKS